MMRTHILVVFVLCALAAPSAPAEESATNGLNENLEEESLTFDVRRLWDFNDLFEPELEPCDVPECEGDDYLDCCNGKCKDACRECREHSSARERECIAACMKVSRSYRMRDCEKHLPDGQARPSE